MGTQIAATDILMPSVELPTRKVLVGLLGAGIGESRTPLMHEREGARLGFRYVYQLMDTDGPEFATLEVEQMVHAARAMGFSGLNVTFPYKQAVMAFLDALSENAERVGAVNTIVFKDGVMRGHNTDLWGFAEGFRRNMDGADLSVVAIFGAGGAGAAVSRALLQLGVQELLIVDIDAERAGELCSRLADDFVGRIVRCVTSAQLAGRSLSGVVNTTPVGMAKTPGLPIDEALIQPHVWIADVIYFPLETELLRLARTRGCRVLPGSGMAVYQAARSFELFTGQVPDIPCMQSTFENFKPTTRQTGG